MTLDKTKVLLGFSGGVDSTASAILLQQQGFDVTGLFFDVFGKKTNNQKRAQEVAKKLNIPLIVEDISSFFKDKVQDYFFKAYINGRTPNPCVQCNKHIKFDFMLKTAKKINAFYIATGHYAQIEYESNQYMIKKPIALQKDQTYMLYNLNQNLLKHILFPLGHIESKDLVRNIVKEANLPNAKTKDSQEICFIPNNNYADFICRNYQYEPKEGNFVDQSGKILGKHHGIIHYTIGQRKGLGITLGEPAYVTHINPEKNIITLGKNESLFKNIVYSENNNFLNIKIDRPLEVSAKIRYSAKPSKAVITLEKNNIVKTTFKEPQRAVTSGQSIVFYSDDVLLGGGVII